MPKRSKPPPWAICRDLLLPMRRGKTLISLESDLPIGRARERRRARTYDRAASVERLRFELALASFLCPHIGGVPVDPWSDAVAPR